MKVFFILLLSIFCFFLQTQQVKLDGIEKNFSKKELFKINGGISADAIYNFENTSSAYDPFNYFIKQQR